MLLPLLIPLLFKYARAFFLSFSHSFRRFISLSRNKYSLRFFSHNFVLFRPFLYAYDLVLWYIYITFHRLRSNWSSTSLSSSLLASRTTNVCKCRLPCMLGPLFLFLCCILLLLAIYFILFVAIARLRSRSPFKVRLKHTSLACWAFGHNIAN